MLLGVHCSVAGGLLNAFTEAAQLGIDTFQMFTQNQRQWGNKVITDSEGNEFRAAQQASDIAITFSHSSYLINLASGKDDLLEKSTKTLCGEVERCTALGLAFTVLHPGSAKDLGEEGAIISIAQQLNTVIRQTPDSTVRILLENTAGQGASIGRNFQQLQSIYQRIESKNRIGFCIDTCHAFAAGYDIRTAGGFEDMMAEFDGLLGLDKLYCLHLNDSKGDCGSKLDRHDHIGHGKLGLEPFRKAMQQFAHIPKVVETAKVDDWDEKNLELLRSLID